MAFEVVPGDLHEASTGVVRVGEVLRRLPFVLRLEGAAQCVAGGALASALSDATRSMHAASLQVAVATETCAQRIGSAATTYSSADSAAMRGCG
jgi:hypothetical protein